ncbi:TAXI family TRAP transporter solute-binding subunit [Photobacterium phosphoreum]|uniref:TAXI family TRAP transporter solute-binding subunit n=1 Tax=Photobacterium phosphoreum TaxID=659 RepID=A0AAW5A0V6_PHOPO|nr:TAXI family TRAP transporter solute-binding subunit [Photobacterium phosphoreum]MCD9491854.1 TAXI family TRAP transporter solute-binding subunit [Photobacterium phosphoreum]MCD9520957.1 TAXI family TRAP transporter solute-binding subunit [Photobacterium phosphoreum]MCF2192301.1 TAXI family TRAP transporter solute-binding subunit [Photobacterium phosphoreum]MCF2303951.1 TAXI family TRAP transporter solute-binding subunit [Photobacterium phosphoreum]PSU33450.1 C4-dicarboxylate ABC transporter
MKLLAIISTLGGILCSSFATAADTFISIGTGGQTGVYYIAGQSICRFVNRTTDTHQIKCNAPTSGGGVANVNGLRSLEYNFGIMQSDHQFKALNGLAPFQDHGKMTDIRAVFSLQSEVFTILAREDSGIHSFEDLKNKRVNLGNPGSGQRDTFEQILAVKNWNSDVFSLVSDLKPAEQAPAMSDNKIDAMSYFVGHPNGAIQEASTTTDTRLIPVTGPEIDALLKEKNYFTKAIIPGGMYRGNPNDTVSIGGKAVLSTNADTDPEMVYQLVKSVFTNIDRFKRLHPAFAELKETDMIKTGLTAPLHNGAIRYYKERGWM